MKITLKKVAIVLAVIFMMPFAYLAKAYWSTNNRMNKYYEVKKYAIAIPDDSASLALGAHLVKIKGCTDCHGENLGGRIFINDPKLAMLPAPNLTKGEGGLSHDYSTEDWVRALRHGLRRDGRSLLMMPSYEFVALTEKDLGSIIAYCQRLPAVDNKLPVAEIGPL